MGQDMFRNKRHYHYVKVISLCFILFLFGCSGGSSEDEQVSFDGTASIVFSVEWQDQPIEYVTENTFFKSKFFQFAQLLFSPLSAEADMDDCLNIHQVRAEVFAGDTKIAEGGPWSCSDHQGTIRNVPAGSGRKVVVYGEISGGKILYRGNRTGITLAEGQTFDAETILCYQNLDPVADAGSYQAVKDGDTVTLNGAYSYDPDLNDGIASYRWTQTAGPSVTLSDVNAVQPTFRAPSVSESTTLTFELTVKDYGGLEGRDNVSITVNSGTNGLEADAGSNRSVTEGDSVTLDGSSSDPADEIVSYQWSQVGGQQVTLSNNNTAKASFIAPSVDTSTTLTFQLTVKDAEGDQDTAAVGITVNPEGTTPTSDAVIDNPLDNTVYKTGDSVVFSASGSENADYEWDFGDGETETGSTSSHPYSNQGHYMVKLIVAGVERDSVIVEVDDNFEVPNPDSFLKFVPIPAGDFLMGPDPNDSGGKTVYADMSGFEMQETEMTQRQWKMIMGSNPSHFKECGDKCPVESVSWPDIQQVINRLNDADDRYKYDLPTEAQWEYACRAGSETKYYFGDDETELKDHAWYDGTANDIIYPVKYLKNNAWGLYDMHGNVQEWCKDILDYSVSYGKDPTGHQGTHREVRGGNYGSHDRACQSNYRATEYRTRRYQWIGFRLVRIPK